MKKFALDRGDLYFGDHEIKIDAGPEYPQIFFDFKLGDFFDTRPEFREYIDLYGQVHNLRNYAILAAHGDANGKWIYMDEGKEHAVQSWINRADGKYSGLLLCVCNPDNHTPKSKTSIIVFPDGNIDFTGMGKEDPTFSMLVPGIGEVDSYVIGNELRKLKETCKKI